MPSPTRLNRGSAWNRWDLHVHTPASALSHSLGNDWDEYVAALIESARNHKVAAIATADYFTIEGYEQLQSYYNKESELLSCEGESVPLYLIPGVELRLNIFNSDNESINLHVLFDPENCSPGFIEQNFLEALKIKYRGKTLNLNEQNVWAIGKSIVESLEPAYGYDFTRASETDLRRYRKEALGVLTLAYASIEDALKQIDEILGSKLPRRAYLVAVVGKGHGGISSLSWFEANRQFSRAGLVREDLTHQADIIFSNDPNDRRFFLGERSDTPPSEVASRFKRLKSCVWGSDAHSLSTLLHPSNGNTRDYTWIKADVGFEGLKQVIFEPDLRVRIQEDNPREEETYAHIETMTLDFPSDLKIKDKDSTEEIPFCIQGRQEIAFSPNLNCIIGGRGSGKSTVIHLLYNIDNKKELSRLADVNSPLFNLQVASRDVLSKVRSVTVSDIPPQTEFFLQNEVEKFARDIGQMSSLITSRLYGLAAVEDSPSNIDDLRGQWLAAVEQVDDLVRSYDEIVRIDDQIATVKKQRDTLKKQTEVISSKEYQNLQNEIRQFASAVSNFEVYTQARKRVSSEIASLIRGLKKLEWGTYETKPVIDALLRELEGRGAELESAFERDKKKHDEAGYANQLATKRTQLRNLLKEKGISPENVGEIAKATEQITRLEAQIGELSREKAPYQEVYERKNDLLLAYQQAYSSYKAALESIAGNLQHSLAGLQFDDRQQTSISFHLLTNDQGLKDACTEFIKQCNPSRVSLRADSIQAVVFGGGALTDLVSDVSRITEAVNSYAGADVHTQILKQMVNDPIFVEKLQLRMQRHYYDIEDIQIQTRLGEKLLQNTSFGERCGIVIAIALVAGTNPIVIDQPEDNLDGKYVSQVLVPLIRSQKQRRQIILVTRDANIAIGGDAELIVILDKEAGGTKPLFSTIENTMLRTKYIWILDGGEVAFRRREEKYAIKL